MPRAAGSWTRSWPMPRAAPARTCGSAPRSPACGRYQAERDELSLRLFRVTGRMASFDWTADQIGEHLLELGAAMAEETAAMTSGDPGLRLELASA